MTWTDATTTIAMVLGTVAYLAALIYAVSYIDGWRALAKHFAASPGTEPRSAEVRRFVSAAILGLAWWQRGNFGWSVFTAEMEMGLYMAPHWWIALGHEPLCIPWDAIAEVVPRGGIGGPYVELHFAVPGLDKRLVLAADAVARLRPHGHDTSDES